MAGLLSLLIGAWQLAIICVIAAILVDDDQK
jgi:hypothetical protein